jgi:hypothetical protein
MTSTKSHVDERHPKEQDDLSDLSSIQQQNHSAMNANALLNEWLSGPTKGKEGIAAKSLKRHRSPSTSREPNKRRVLGQNHALPTDDTKEQDFEGPTLVNGDEVMGGTGEMLEPQTLGAPCNAPADLDGDTMITDEEHSTSSGKIENWSAGYLSDDTQDDRFIQRVDGKSMELPKLDQRLSGMESDYESDMSAITEISSSGSEESDEDMMITPTKNGRSRSGSGSIRPDQDIYRPSPDIVDKDLASDIVSRDAQESDLSEEELLPKKVRVRKGERKEVAFDDSVERERRWTAAVNITKGNWGEAEQDLYLRMAMRGFEPIIPGNWRIDFPTLPMSLFAKVGSPEPYIHSVNVKEFRGK